MSGPAKDTIIGRAQETKQRTRVRPYRAAGLSAPGLPAPVLPGPACRRPRAAPGRRPNGIQSDERAKTRRNDAGGFAWSLQ